MTENREYRLCPDHKAPYVRHWDEISEEATWDCPVEGCHNHVHEPPTREQLLEMEKMAHTPRERLIVHIKENA